MNPSNPYHNSISSARDPFPGTGYNDLHPRSHNPSPRRMNPSVELFLEIRIPDPVLKTAIAEALAADAADPRFPFKIEVHEESLRIRPARPLDAGDADAFINSALSLLKAAYFTLVSVKSGS